ncbi:hypothetical protein [Paenibacillus vortex]|uniref:hypothetical protein n=1 Tax=Paenibacillus vortex TaxID=71995 RepID=UPI0002EF5AAD|nr:hypothetical protein [Paenibacillus vortex]
MAKIVFALNQSLDGFVDHDHPAFQPDPLLFRHFIDDVSGLSGILYGRRMYENMRVWDGFEWGAPEREFDSGVAKQTEVGGVEDVKIRRSERFSDRG